MKVCLRLTSLPGVLPWLPSISHFHVFFQLCIFSALYSAARHSLRFSAALPQVTGFVGKDFRDSFKLSLKPFWVHRGGVFRTEVHLASSRAADCLAYEPHVLPSVGGMSSGQSEC